MRIYLSGLWGSTLNLSTVLRFILLITNVAHHQSIPNHVCAFADDRLPWEIIGKRTHGDLWLIRVVLISLLHSIYVRTFRGARRRCSCVIISSPGDVTIFGSAEIWGELPG